ncbi:MAG: DnaJ domain-containing protein [Pseudomonadaceae bacterium]|nr:DnaJ domain-containing protein [Pseudomonadaceae bacterium]
MYWPITAMGALAGMLLASIPGALLGGLLGQVLDRRLDLQSWADLRRRMQGVSGPREQQLLFGLLGRLAKSAGAVTAAHIQQARNEMRRLQLDEAAQQLAIAAFTRGKNAEQSLRRPLRQRRANRALADELLRACWRMAWAGGQVAPAQYQLILDCGEHLGLQRDAVLALGAAYARSNAPLMASAAAEQEALRVLGLSAEASPAQIKQAYRRLLSRHHPDKVAGSGASPAQVRAATDKTCELHRAFELLRNRRDFP